MSKKGSYWQKHKLQIGEDSRTKNQRPALAPLTEACRAEFEEGKVILVDKPVHWTSFDVVRKIRNAIGIKKVGHAGTLDPLATGLLIVCTGRFTKKINEYMAREKEYTGSFTIGAVTPTYDLESTPVSPKDISGITENDLLALLPRFTGEIEQFPPVYSAIKKEGTPLYELARRGEDVELKARTITINEFEITSVEFPVVYFRIVCSTGTYIRSIAHDFGAALGCGAYLSALRRTRIGEFTVDEATDLDGFLSGLKRKDMQMPEAGV